MKLPNIPLISVTASETTIDFYIRYLTFYVMLETLAGRELPVVIVNDFEKLGVFTREGRLLILMQNEYYMLIPVLPTEGWALPMTGKNTVKYLRW